MNENLKKELETYFWSGRYDEEITRYSGAEKESSRVLRELRKDIDDKTYFKYESEIASVCCEHEYEGFLQGYMRCLTMMGQNIN